MEILDNLQYTENHEWILLESGIATIGITDYAQKELGDIVYVDIDTLGETLDVDSIFGSVEAVKTVSDLFMPIAGKVIEFNTNLETNPELINQQPYLDGWIIKVKTDDIAVNSKLLTSDEYKNHVGLE